MRWTSFLGLPLSGLLLSACATFQEAPGLDVALVNLRLEQATVWETTAHCTVRVSNATPEPVVLNGGAHKFYLDGSCIGEGLSDQRVEVPRLNSVTQDVTVHLRNVALATRLKPILEARAFDYRIKSTLYLDDGHRSHRVQLAHEGRLGADDFQPNFQPRAVEGGKSP